MSIVPMDYFEWLPEGFIFEILSRTTPADVVRSTTLSKEFKSTTELDELWERFLPADYQEIIDRSELPPVYNTKKDLFFSLCDSPILLDGSKLSFSLDNHSGKKCFMISSGELIIFQSPNTYFWQWKKHPDSRFSEVPYFGGLGSLYILKIISSQMLSKRTTYIMYLVFKLEPNLYDDLVNGNSVARFCNRQTEVIRRIDLPNVQRRADGWMEIEMGRFFNDFEEEIYIDARVMEIRYRSGIGNLVIEGIEFRPE